MAQKTPSYTDSSFGTPTEDTCSLGIVFLRSFAIFRKLHLCQLIKRVQVLALYNSSGALQCFEDQPNGKKTAAVIDTNTKIKEHCNCWGVRVGANLVNTGHCSPHSIVLTSVGVKVHNFSIGKTWLKPDLNASICFRMPVSRANSRVRLK